MSLRGRCPGRARMETRFLPDTSCLVAGVCSWHEHHAGTAEEPARRAKRREEMVMAACRPSVEAYAVLTRLPPPYRLRPQDALAVMVGSRGDGGGRGDDRRRRPGPSSGRCPVPGSPRSSDDAHVAACARKATAGVILAWNVRDFERVAEASRQCPLGTGDAPVHGYSRAQPGGRPVRRNSSVRSARAWRACFSSSVSTCSLTLICTGMPW